MLFSILFYLHFLLLFTHNEWRVVEIRLFHVHIHTKPLRNAQSNQFFCFSFKSNWFFLKTNCLLPLLLLLLLKHIKYFTAFEYKWGIFFDFPRISILNRNALTSLSLKNKKKKKIEINWKKLSIINNKIFFNSIDWKMTL